jgi:hypothetical protein
MLAPLLKHACGVGNSPVPVSCTVFGLFVPLLLIVKVAGCDPLVAGAKLTLNVHVPAGKILFPLHGSVRM